MGAKYGTPDQTARSGDVILLAVPWPQVPNALKDVEPLQGKILIDCTNLPQIGQLWFRRGISDLGWRGGGKASPRGQSGQGLQHDLCQYHTVPGQGLWG